MDRGSLEKLLSQGLSLAEIGRRFGLHEATVGYWVQTHGLVAVNREKHAARGGLEMEALARMVETGATIAEIAAAVERSKATVRHWLARYGLRTKNTRGRRGSAEVQAAKEAGQAELMMTCPKHGVGHFVIDGRGYYRCRRCRAEAVSRRRQKVKRILVEEAGGCCQLCGYRDNPRALHFHHVDPSEKRIEINAKGVALALDKLRIEARKCVLLCSNCHAEVEDGMAVVPANVLKSPPG